MPQALESRHPGCIEMRWKFNQGCEYDGKVASTVFRGNILLYVRNNMNEFGGDRFVGVTSAPSHAPAGPFRPMQLITIQGYSWCTASQNNVYMAAVAPNPADPRTLVGLFPFSGKAKFFNLAARDRLYHTETHEHNI